MTEPVVDPRTQLQSALGDAYVVEREVGSGGMATVWLAHDRKHKRPVAIKVLHPHLAASVGADRFQREIEVAARLQHPHILSVHDSGNANGLLWFSMPFIEGETLRARLERERQLPVAEAVRITREASQALQYAHNHGVVHRDIKPENLLLTSDGSTLVADFGVARALGVDADLEGQRFTETGMVVGTPQYMSPEQASGERVIDARTDMYSLATVLYEMLAGEPPFTGPNPQTIRAKMLSGPPPSVRRSRPSIAPKLDAALDRALAPAPADRYGSVAEFARTLTTAEMATQGALLPHSARRREQVLAIALAAVLVLGAAAIWYRLRPPASPVGNSALAVLPFENDGDTSNAYFADGITDEIRGKLTALPALRVIARASSNQYRRTEKSPQQIAQELGAGYLLTGVVRWETSPNRARRVRVSPELVQISRENAPRTIWQQTYDTTLADVFQVQSAVAGEVAANLGILLKPQAQAQLAQKPTQNLAAYEAYLRSTSFDGVDLPSLRRALAEANRAVELDSNFAAAWARVGQLHAVIFSNGTQVPANGDSSRVATNRAVMLAPGAYETWISRAFYWTLVATNQSRALADLDTAYRLAPSSADVLRSLGQLEATVGLWDKGLAHIRQAAELDPRSSTIATRLTRALLSLHRYPEARAAAAHGLLLSPDNLTLLQDRAISYVGEGDLAGARASLRKIPGSVDRAALAAFIANYWDMYWLLDSADVTLVQTLSPASFDGDRGLWSLVRAQVFHEGGDSARARAYADTAARVLTTVLRDSPNNLQTLLFRALTFAYQGKRADAILDRDRGLALSIATKDEWSTIAYAHHLAARIDLALGDRQAAISELSAIAQKPYFISPGWLRIDPTWNPLRGDPQFEKLAHADGK
ncbi:MAG: protein kinase [Gemmatimonadota bacterium]